MEKLKFIETLSVSEFKTQQGVEKLEVKQVVSPEDGEMFFMLHQRGEGGAPIVAVL